MRPGLGGLTPTYYACVRLAGGYIEIGRFYSFPAAGPFFDFWFREGFWFLKFSGWLSVEA